jgi:hypothetical protein
MSGTPSTPEESALPVFINGLKLNAFPAAAGRRIRTGMSTDIYIQDEAITYFADRAVTGGGV